MPNLSQSIQTSPFTAINSTLPLAVYREVAAHLRQVTGVEADLLPQTSPDFNYADSQVGGMTIRFAPDSDRQRLQQILDYYGDRFGQWTIQ
jgi:hypothetical protein